MNVPPRPEPEFQLCLYIPRALAFSLETYCIQAGLSQGAIVRKAVEEYLGSKGPPLAEDSVPTVIS